MAYDFSDPNQVREFRQKALEMGKDQNRVDDYISIRRREQAGATGIGTDLKSLQQQRDILKTQKEIGELSGITTSDIKGMRGKLDTLSQVDEILSRDLGPVTGFLKLRAKIPGTEAKGTQREIERLKAMLSLENREKMKGTGQISDFESRMLADAATSLDQDMSESDFKRELVRIRSILGRDLGVTGMETPGSAVGQKKNEYSRNIDGKIPVEGDLMRDRATGELTRYGDDKALDSYTSFDDGKIRTDNKLINFLANSKFLPIAGGVLGSIAGAGVGSIATGAIGAAGGETLKRGLIELLDPDQATGGQHAKAILTEGITDAAFGLGAGFIVAPAAKGAFKLILNKGGRELAERGARELAEEGVEAVGKKAVPILGTQAEIMQRAIRPGRKLAESVQKRYGQEVGEAAVETLGKRIGEVKDPASLIKVSQEVMEEHGKAIEKKLAGKALKTQPIIDDLQALIKSKEELGEIAPEFLPGIKRVEVTIRQLQNAGDEIGAKQLNKLKKSLAAAFKGSVTVEEGAKQLKREAYGKIMGSLEKMDPTLRNSNKGWFIADTLSDIGFEAQRKQGLKSMLNLYDVIFGGVGLAGGAPGALGGVAISKMLQKVANDPYTQLRVANKLINLGLAKGNKVGVRTMLRGIQNLDVPIEFGVSEALLKGAMRGPSVTQQALRDLRGEEAIPPMPEANFNPQVEQASSGIPTQIPQGGGSTRGIGVNLGAYSQEGVPLYR